MNLNQQLKLQAFLDNELSSREAKEVAQWMEQDAEARQLFTELSHTRAALHQNELEVKLPESREFFWSKIERDIRLQSQQPVSTGFSPDAILAWLYRHLVPASAVALVAIFAIFLATKPAPVKTVAMETMSYGEVETLNEEMGSISFRSESERMTVIYLYNRADDSEAGVSNDGLIQ